ncbi:MAG: hypothetical protein SCARUB_05243 [Candidatus Scalindua rubra]|uniref:Uncharacterized protein n=1 Tax=Candidatus Scalindua rubra TaxID=1872076 RepID=A0A1E3X232_9BACT|nr:MAG: hypothetical protein SCARUB_05243 [Candidatus Scalindua rubra]
MGIKVDKNELYSLIKEAVREVLHEETLEFFFKSIPSVSKEEMEDIKKLYGKPSADKEEASSETVEI